MRKKYTSSQLPPGRFQYESLWCGQFWQKQLCFFIAFLAMTQLTMGAIINVPADQPTIQAAVDAASAGDEIVVADGIYNETVNINNTDAANLIIRAANIGGATVNGQGGSSAFRAIGYTGDLTINGFVVNSTSTTATVGVVKSENQNGRFTVINCIFTPSATSFDTRGIIVNNTSNDAQCTILDNTFGAFGNDDIIDINTSGTGAVDILVDGNTNKSGGTYSSIEDEGINIEVENGNTTAVIVVTNNDIGGFTASGRGIEMLVGGSGVSNLKARVLVEGNTFVDANGGAGIQFDWGGTNTEIEGVFNNNTLTGDGTTDEGFYFDSEDGAQNVSTTLFVTNNNITTVTDAGIRFRPFGDGTPNTHFWVVDNNTIDDVNTGSGEAAIYIDASSTSTLNKYDVNVEITNNTMTDLSSECIRIEELSGATVEYLLNNNNGTGCGTPDIVGVPAVITDPVPASAALGSIGNFVWNDINQNGIQDGGAEVGVGGVQINFTGGGFTGSTSTNSSGNYSIPALPAGTYTLTIEPTAALPFVSAKNIGANDNLDSDFDPTTKQVSVTLTVGQTNNTIDAGLTGTETASCIIANSTCPADITVNNDPGNCSAVVNIPDPTIPDDCGSATFSYAPASGSTFPVGTTEVTATISDGNGGQTTCTLDVIVNDTEAPIAVCQNISVYLDAAGMASIVAGDIDGGSSDNCPSISLAASQTSFDCFGGNPNITLTVTDGSGNQSTCGANVTVLDTIPPTVVCQDITAYLNGSGSVSLTLDDVSTINDNCGISEFGEFSFACANIGQNIKTINAIDRAGNSATCSSTITVVDSTAPVAVCQDISVFLNGSGMASITSVDVNGGSSDNCGIDSMAVTPNIFGCSDVGANTVSLQLFDASSNFASCIATVTVVDSTPPVARCQDISVFLNGSGLASITTADVDGGSSDNCGIDSMAVIPNIFGCSDVGANTVSLQLFDASSNFASCIATVTVVDSTPPVARCQDISVFLNGSGLASITTADVDGGSSDNCGIDSMAVIPNIFGCSDVGANTVSLQLFDASSNFASCIATVTVVDSTPPVARCQDISVFLNGSGMASITTADVDGGSSDNCGIDSMAVIPNIFGCSDVGANIVSLQLFDASSNFASCIATVTVVDSTPPVARCQDISVFLNGSGLASITTADVDGGSSDNCGIDSMAVIPNIFGCSDVGANTVSLQLFDASSNFASCIATVTVVDSTPPVARCQDISVFLNGNGLASITTADVDGGSSDNCGIDSMAVIPNIFGCSDVGANTVSLQLFDASSNFASCIATVTVVDSTPPVARCQDISVFLNGSGLASITTADIDGGSLDNCGIDSMAVIPNIFGCSDVGANTVSLQLFDASGNFSSCLATVTVVDSIRPVITCQELTFCNVLGEEITLTPEDFITTLSDNCSDSADIATMLSQSVFTDADLGENMVTVTATDENNNSSTCETKVHLVGFGAVVAGEQSECNPFFNTYTQDLEITYAAAPGYNGNIVVNGQVFPATGSPQVVTLVDLVSDLQPVDVLVSFEGEFACPQAFENVFTAPQDCSVRCDITEIRAGAAHDCDEEAGTYQQDIIVHYQGTNLTGFILVEIDGDNNFIPFPIEYTDQQIITLTLPLDGQEHDVFVKFSDDQGCSFRAERLFRALHMCGCDIVGMDVLGEPRCNPDGTYNIEFLVEGFNVPVFGGMLQINGQMVDYNAYPALGGLEIFVRNLPGNGERGIDVFFKAEDGCTWTARDLYDAPRCEVDPCRITGLRVLNATCTDPDPTYDLQMQVSHQNAPNSGTLDIEILGTTYNFPIEASPQVVNIFGLPASGAPVAVEVRFSDDRDCNLRLEDFYDAPDCGFPCLISDLDLMGEPICDGDGEGATYSVDVIVTYENAPPTGSLRVSINGTHTDAEITGSPQIVTVQGLVPGGLPTDVTASFTDNGNCMRTEPDMFISPECGIAQPCDLFDIELRSLSECYENNGTYDVCFDLTGIRLPENNNEPDFRVIVGGQEISRVYYQMQTNDDRTEMLLCISGIEADGREKDVFIQVADGCSKYVRRLYTAPACEPEDEDPDDRCDITSIEATQNYCDGDGTYTQRFVLRYNDAPATGQIALEINGEWRNYDITSSPQTIVVPGLRADGRYVRVFAKFTDVDGCTIYERNLYRAPSDCRSARMAGTQREISIFPNPSNGKFQIMATADSYNTADVKVFNKLGQLVKEMEITENTQATLDLVDQPEGIYTVRITGDTYLVTQKVQVVK